MWMETPGSSTRTIISLTVTTSPLISSLFDPATAVSESQPSTCHDALAVLKSAGEKEKIATVTNQGKSFKSSTIFSTSIKHELI